MSETDSKLTVRLRPGRKPRHGGYTFMRSGKIPEDKIEIERYLTFIRQGYISDIGPTEDDLSTGQLILLDTLITLKGVNRCVEIEAAKAGDIRSLDERYNSRNNQIVKICLSLGIEQNSHEIELTMTELSKVIEEEDQQEVDKS